MASPRAQALTASLGMFMAILDNVIVNVALLPIARDLHSDLHVVQWIVTAYFLAQAATIPAAGYLGERFGLKRTYLAFLALFTLGSLLCGITHAVPSLLTARVIQGVGAGGLIPLAQAAIFGAFPPSQRAKAATLLSIPLLFAPTFGPALGGILTHYFGWPAIFLVNLPFGALALGLAWRNLPADPALVRASSRDFDWGGLALSTAGAAVLCYAITRFAETDSPGSLPLAWLGGGLALAAAFVAHALARRQRPVLDLRLLRRRDFAASSALAWFHSGLFFGSIFLIPIYLLQDHQPALSLVAVGWLLLPQGLGAAASVLVNGRLFYRLGPRAIVLGGTLLLALTSLLISRTGPETSAAAWIVLMLLRGVSFGCCFLIMQTNAFHDLTRDELPRASSLFNVNRMIFSSIGLSAAISLMAHETALAGPERFQRSFAWLGVVTLLLVPVCLLIPPRRRPQPATEPAPAPEPVLAD